MLDHLLYAPQVRISLSDILRDLDIAITATIDVPGVEKIIDCCGTSDATDILNNIINACNIKDIVVILDKLQCMAAIDMLLKSDIIPVNNQFARTATINHSLTQFQFYLQNTYVRTNMYGALRNHNNPIVWMNNKICDAIQNGLCVKNMKTLPKNTITDDDIKCCTSLTRLSITNKSSQITTCAPFAKTLRELSVHINYDDDFIGIDDNALSSCTNLVELNAELNYKITTCAPFAKSLKILRANMHSVGHGDMRKICCEKNCGITNDGLSQCTNIEILHATDNVRITTCAPFANTLKKLNANGCCGITDDGLSTCTKIQQLCAVGNIGITTCAPFSNTLTMLLAGADNYGLCGITDAGLSLCSNISNLDAHCNQYITTCEPFARSLKKLNASNRIAVNILCGISDAGLSLCCAIRELYANYNPKITTCAPFAKSIKILSASGETCGIADTGLTDCIKINKLFADNNPKITTCASFAKTLTILGANDYCGINDEGISRCTSITTLYASNNPKITTCAPFAKTLNILYATCKSYTLHKYCGISDAGLRTCHHIKKLFVSDNRKITTCAPFARTLKILRASGKECGMSNNSVQSCNALTHISAYDNPKIDKRCGTSLKK